MSRTIADGSGDGVNAVQPESDDYTVSQSRTELGVRHVWAETKLVNTLRSIES